MPRKSTPAPEWTPARLAQLVSESGLSYRAVHAAGGPDPANLTRILSGDTTPKADTLLAILTAVGKGWCDLSRPVTPP